VPAGFYRCSQDIARAEVAMVFEVLFRMQAPARILLPASGSRFDPGGFFP